MSSTTAAGPDRRSEPSPRMRAILDAALSVVATHGLRGLTHRAVDRAAGLPEGSTSAYLRTRRALQIGLAGHVADRLGTDVDRVLTEIGCLDDGDPAAVQALVRLFTGWVEDRDLLVAKVELTMEAARDPELAEPIRHDRERVVGLVAAVVDDHHHDRPTERAQTLVAAFDGVLLAALLREGAERTAFLNDALSLLMPVTGAPGPDPTRR
ncbi:ABC-F family ATP-binding cassette domain-containing protein [Nocardioides marinquilinus]|uniref:ABC-F family ATP-binding cassette domain-containing protein n=1 Tax=Nocardioides marinquilinus TaxID=1210400 RepID=A0ABP9Q1W9_9ACTN